MIASPFLCLLLSPEPPNCLPSVCYDVSSVLVPGIIYSSPGSAQAPPPMFPTFTSPQLVTGRADLCLLCLISYRTQAVQTQISVQDSVTTSWVRGVATYSLLPGLRHLTALCSHSLI